MEHHDNKGGHGVIAKGDVQWMTAGRGIVHQEYHSKEFTRTGGTFEVCFELSAVFGCGLPLVDSTS